MGIDSHVVEGIDDLHRLLADWPIGKPVGLTVLRRGRNLEIEAVSVEPYRLRKRAQ